MDVTIEKKTPPFWLDDPNILLKQEYIFEFFPTSEMTFEQKLNAITRSVILFSIVLIIVTRKPHLLFIVLLTLIIIGYYYFVSTKKSTEGFTPQTSDYIMQEASKEGKMITEHMAFDESSPENPFSNVLMNDFTDNVDKLPAPSFNLSSTNDKILQNAKRAVELNNPGQPDIANKLFRDLGEQFTFEQSLRQFNSNPSTTIPNDQEAFANFCYGSMTSCKEGNAFACVKHLDNHYNLY